MCKVSIKMGKLSFALIKSTILVSILLSMLINHKVIAESSNKMISEICKKTRNPPLCLQVLKSNRKARKASSLVALGEISTEMAESSAKATKNMILMSSVLTRDRELKERYKLCAKNYDSAIYYLKLASQYMKGGRDFAKVSRHVAAALKEPVSCQENFAAKPPAVPTELKEGNDKLECLCSVLLVISKRSSARYILKD